MAARIPHWLLALLAFTLSPSLLTSGSGQALAQTASHTFPETGKTVRGKFLQYWLEHGGLPQYGYPISDELEEVSSTDGKTYTVQYFERAVYELHPENAGTRYEVLLSLLGVHRYREYYGPGGAPYQRPNTNNARFFPETGHALGGKFRAYWEANGGLLQQGFPISDEFEEVSALDGKAYTVQYFERAVFELHPENAGTQYEVLLAHIGRQQYQSKYGDLLIPAPLSQHHAQHRPIGTSYYLFWQEHNMLFQLGRPPTLRAMDVRTNKLVTLPARFYGRFAVYAHTIVWAVPVVGEVCTIAPCSSDIMGADLRTGDTFLVASGAKGPTLLTIHGRNVAWFEHNDKDKKVSLLVRELGTDRETIVASWSSESWSLLDLAVGDEHAAWIEWNFQAEAYNVRAFNLKTQRSETIIDRASLAGGDLDIAITGHYLVRSGPKLFLSDLHTGETTTLFEGQVSGLVVRDDIVIWQSGNLWGLKLTDRKALQLRFEEKTEAYTVAGGWFVWARPDWNSRWARPDCTNCDRLLVKRLVDLLADVP